MVVVVVPEAEQPVMRRGVTLGERGADKAADWEPSVLTSVGYS